MSNEVSAIVWKRDFGSAVRKVIAARLADHADDEGRGIWPSVERIAAQCNVSERTVQRTLADFVREKILHVVSEGGRGPGDSARYDFNMASVEALPLAKWGSKTKGDTLSPLQEKGDTLSEKGDTSAKKGCQGGTQTITEPSGQPSLVEQQFLEMIRAWPTGFADRREGLRTAWAALSEDDRQDALARAPEYLSRLKSAGRDFIPSLKNYLLERQWVGLPARPTRQQNLEQATPSPPAPTAFMRSRPDLFGDRVVRFGHVQTQNVSGETGP